MSSVKALVAGDAADAAETFEMHTAEYDAWYEWNRPAYISELLALKQFLPANLDGLKALEIGVGTGRFAGPLGVRYGVDPVRAMTKFSKKRNIEVFRGVAEALPFKSESFDLVMIVTSLCFFEDPAEGLKEASRALKPGGQLLIGMLDRDSPLGRYYESKKVRSDFSFGANYLSAAEVFDLLLKSGYEELEACQTLSGVPEEMKVIERAWPGLGEGGFAAISGRRPDE